MGSTVTIYLDVRKQAAPMDTPPPRRHSTGPGAGPAAGDPEGNGTIVLDSPAGDPMVTQPPAPDAAEAASLAPGALAERCSELTAQLRVLRDKCRLLEREAQYERERTREVRRCRFTLSKPVLKAQRLWFQRLTL